MNINEQVQQVSQDTVIKIASAVGGGGVVMQAFMTGLNVFIVVGSAVLIAGSLYLMYPKIIESSKRQDKGEGDG